MKLSDALQETGCAMFRSGDCATSVERLSDEQYLLMTRKGVCILQCQIVSLTDVERLTEVSRDVVNATWSVGRIEVVEYNKGFRMTPFEFPTEDVAKKYPAFNALPRKPFNPDEPFGLVRDARGGFTMIGPETLRAIEEDKE